jgi:hypothetical protein
MTHEQETETNLYRSLFFEKYGWFGYIEKEKRAKDENEVSLYNRYIYLSIDRTRTRRKNITCLQLTNHTRLILDVIAVKTMSFVALNVITR